MTNVNQTFLPHIKALDALVSLGICSKTENLMEDNDCEYSFKIEIENFFSLLELQAFQKQFLADELKIGYYYDTYEEKDCLAVELYFRNIGDTSGER
jgi:hypothetical protein